MRKLWFYHIAMKIELISQPLTTTYNLFIRFNSVSQKTPMWTYQRPVYDLKGHETIEN